MQNNEITSTIKILGWHFSNDTKLGFRDNRPIVVSETFSVEGDIILCQNALHISKKALDAFQYIQGKYLWRVELEGDLESYGNSIDKWVGKSRKFLAGGNATEMLLKFGLDCALDVIHLLLNAPEEVKTFLKTGIITKVVDDYFDYKNAAAYNFFYVINAYNAVYSVYKAYKQYNVYYVYDTISFATYALNILFETYTDKFEEVCLKFIEEMS